MPKVCEKCGKPSTFRCPKCAELGLPDSFFCSQECYRAAWKDHKPKHIKGVQLAEATVLAMRKAVDTAPAGDVRFAGYEFTGKLRPFPRTPSRKVPEGIQRPDYADTETGASECEEKAKGSGVIEVKTPAQILGMREACRIAREVIDEAGRAVRPGVTTDEIDRVVHEATIERGAYPSPLNYYKFPKSVCTSVNEIICHGIPDTRELQEGDVVNVDVTCFYKGFHGDVNETYPVGEVDATAKKMIQVCYESLDMAIAAVKPNMMYRDFGDIISKHVNKAGFSVVRSYTGHGIGELFHTLPTVPHYQGNKTAGIVHPGHTFTIEPMINEGGYQSTSWPDDWTVSTMDGKRSVQFEQTLLATETGCDILTKRTEKSYPYWFLSEQRDAHPAPTSAEHDSRVHHHK